MEVRNSSRTIKTWSYIAPKDNFQPCTNLPPLSFPRAVRFERTGETAFVHDPNYKPPHTVVDKWYRTEVGSKNSLAGRVEESRWQSCHSMQTGREPRKLNGSRLSLDEKKAGPGPASYHIRDPWEVRVRNVTASYLYIKFIQGNK